MDKRITEELLKQARLADKVDKERADLCQALVVSPGWKVYVELLEAQIQTYADTVLAPASSADQCIVLEGLKGTMRGLIAARDLPSVIIAAMKDLKPTSDEESAT